MLPVSPAEWYSYAIVRIIPRVERGESMNAGVILFLRAGGILCARMRLDRQKLAHLDPEADAALIDRHLQSFLAVCKGAPDAGPIAELPADERFHWLTAPRSTIVQTSPVHEGRTSDVERTLACLFRQFVGPD